MRNISIPDSAFVNGEGSFSIPLTLRRGRRFVASMSDSTDLVAGGTSELLVVGPPPPNTGCNTTEPSECYHGSTRLAILFNVFLILCSRCRFLFLSRLRPRAMQVRISFVRLPVALIEVSQAISIHNVLKCSAAHWNHCRSIPHAAGWSITRLF